MPQRAVQWCCLVALAAASAASWGCAAFSGQPQYPYSGQQIAAYAASFSKSTVDDCTDLAKGLAEAATPDPVAAAAARACRDKIITDQLAVIDFAYSSFKSSVSKTAGGFDTGGDILAAATSGASTVIAATETKNILSALSTVITGGRTSFDKNLLLQQTLQVILARMDALRTTAIGPIRDGLSHNVVLYPLADALRDINTYIVAGSLSTALNDLQKSSGDKQASAEQAAQDKIQLRYGADANTQKLRSFWKPDGRNINTDNGSKLSAELTKLKLDIDVAQFIYAQQYAVQRTQAVKDLGL